MRSTMFFKVVSTSTLCAGSAWAICKALSPVDDRPKPSNATHTRVSYPFMFGALRSELIPLEETKPAIDNKLAPINHKSSGTCSS